MSNLSIICSKKFPDIDWSESEILGSMVWLWSQEKSRLDTELQCMMSFLLPPIKLEQFILFYDSNLPVGYISWANFNASVEQLYLESHFNLMQNADWNCGDRSWVIDFFAPFGHYKEIIATVRNLFSNAIVRSSSHKLTGDINKDVLVHKGVNVTRAEASKWSRLNPLNNL